MAFQHLAQHGIPSDVVLSEEVGNELGRGCAPTGNILDEQGGWVAATTEQGCGLAIEGESSQSCKAPSFGREDEFNPLFAGALVE